MADAQGQSMGEFDYVIVGAGTAGCLLANRLSADPGTKVLLLEAGGKDDYIWIHIPIGYLYTINNPRTDWRFQTEAEEGLNGRALAYPRGRVLGGCSTSRRAQRTCTRCKKCARAPGTSWPCGSRAPANTSMSTSKACTFWEH